MEKKGIVSFNKILCFCLAAAIALICVGGVSPIPNNLRPFLMVGIAVFLLGLIFMGKQKVYINIVRCLFVLFLAYITISVLFSSDRRTTFTLVIAYFCATMLLFADFPESIWDNIMRAMRIICLVIAISILISFFVEDSMLTYFSFIVNPGNSAAVRETIRMEIEQSNAHSGFAREKGEAAYIMNVGIMIYFTKFFGGKKFRIWDYGALVVLFLALIFTGKRMLFVCPIIAVSILYLFFSTKSKRKKIIPVAAIVASVGVCILSFFPEFTSVFDRFADTESMESMSGRDDLWRYSLMMFEESPLFGKGLGAYNAYAYRKGLRMGGQKWKAFGHNVYYELLGEVGIVGCLLLFGALIMTFVITCMLLKNKNISLRQRRILIFSVSIQIICFVYSITGNVLLYRHQVYLWYIAVAMTLCVLRNINLLKRGLANE